MIKKHSLKNTEDDKRVLKNPHKGWYWHYFDNGFKRPMYRDKTPEGETYEGFPGLNHLYLRIDWADVQPAPGVFDWSEIDSVMEKWGALGYTFSFRVCCNESWAVQRFAAPEWLYGMGCGGGFYGDGCWEPDYGDPLFLKYLDLFLKGFAEKYDGCLEVEYIDIGSYGCWGEGHTYRGSKKCFGLDVLKKHCILHARHFKKTKIIVNDDFITQLYGRPEEEKAQLRDFCYSLGFGIRDDSVLVGSWDYKDYCNVEHTELYDMFYDNAPSNIELAHYHHYTAEQAKSGLRIIDGARRCNVTYMGFHGYPEEWLADNYYVTEYLANRLGYWFFVPSVSHSDTAYTGAPSLIELEIENGGFAKCYNNFDIQIKYFNNQNNFIFNVSDFDITEIEPGESRIVRHFCRLPSHMPTGKYKIGVRLIEGKTPVELGIKEKYRGADGFYTISEITVRESAL